MRSPTRDRFHLMVLLFAFFNFALTGCGDDPAEMTCTPGAVQECPCADGGTGIQNCTADGLFDACQCSGDGGGDAGIGDTGDDDAGENNAGGDDAGDNSSDPDSGDETPTNECGGDEDLQFDGGDALPGDPCGPCDDGVLACDGENALQCTQASTLNACGACGTLEDEPGASCGSCNDGVFQCNDDGSLSCVDDSETNACGGCSDLNADPLDACDDNGAPGVYECQDQDTLVCVTDGMNLCGGTDELAETPNTPCGTCGQGFWVCDGTDDVTCQDEDAGVNDCGGCAVLPNEAGAECGDCNGEWVCDGTNSLTCDDPQNACGGCDDLPNTPGQSCGDDGLWACDGTDDVVCDEETTANACGGTETLSDEPGDSCGDCNDGEYICVAPNLTSCIGASTENACGGCGGLAGTPGESCGPESEWQCDEDQTVECVFLGEYNQCGGITELEGVPGTTCDDCGTWSCDGDESVTCLGATDLTSDPNNCGACGTQCSASQFCDGGSCQAYNGCGGESDLPGEPGDTCGDCGTWACDGDEALTCQGEVDLDSDVDNCGVCGNQCSTSEFCQAGQCLPYNACGGMSSLAGEPGEACDNCGTWECDGANAVSCQDQVDLDNDVDNCGACGNQCSGDAYCEAGECNQYNSCGGTSDLPGEEGETCQSCGTWACDGDEALSCVGGADLTSDDNNCGACGNSCFENGEYCEDSVCEVDKVVQVEAGSHSTCILRESGEASCRGGGTSVLESPLQNVEYLSMGNDHSCAIMDDGQVYCWGANTIGELGRGNTSTSAGPAPVPGLTNVTDISAGYGHTCAISLGQVYCWGRNANGQLGDGTNDNQLSPVPVDDQLPASATSVGVGWEHSCAIANDRAYCWGTGTSGQLGNGQQTDSNTPVTVSNIGDVQAISAGRQHSCALSTTDSVFCWGNYDSAVAVTVSGLGATDRISAGRASTCAQETNGELYCWGSNKHGVLGIGSDIGSESPEAVAGLPDDLTSISIGDFHACTAAANGQILCWGHNEYGQLYDNQLSYTNFSEQWEPRLSPDIPPITSEYGRCFDTIDNSGNGLVDCEDPDCAEDIGSVTGDYAIAGQLKGFGTHYTQASCGGQGAELLYQWTAPTTDTYVFSTTADTGDLVLLYMRDACAGSELSCATDGGTNDRPRMEVDVEAGETYTLVVDTDNTSSSGYDQFTIHINPL